MKKSAFKASAIFLAAMGAFGAANAQSAKISFNGDITPTTCVLSQADTNNKTVELGNVKPTDFTQAGSTSGEKPFTLTLEGCSTPGNGHPSRASVQFSGTNINTNTNNLNLIGVGTTGVARGIQVRILNANSTKVLLGAANQNVVQQDIVGGGTPTVLPFTADYVAMTLPIGIGSANTAVDVKITYP